MIDILKNIESIRIKKGIKQSEIGSKLGVKQAAYSNWVNRSADMPFGRLESIAKVLGVSVLDIITYPDHYVPESEVKPECEECKKKQDLIDNLNSYIKLLKKQNNYDE